MEKYLEIFKKLGKGKTAVLIGAAAFVVAALIVLVLFNQGPEYQVLYSNLSQEDSGAVIEKLKEKRIPYKVDGSAITVPSEKVYETRMELAGQGVPQGGGIGFEIFDKTSFGVTDFVQKVNYKRALQGELSRTISQIKEVESARVHLAIPEKGVFLDEQKKARASVILKLKQGNSLSQGQVSSIVHLVANSTDNMRPEDVTVVDTAGRMWTKASDEDNPLRLTASQLEYKRSLEKDIESRVQTMLEKAVGQEKVVARVSVDIDNKHVERTEEKYDPDGQVVRSEQRNKEKSTGATYALGIPGVMSNLPDASSQNPNSNNSAPPQTQRQDEVINYEISKVTSHVVEPTGGIKRVTVAVLVDGIYDTAKGSDGKEVKKYNARSEEELAKFTEMVKGAVGFSQERGDVITVVSTPFEAEFSEAELVMEKEPIIPPNMMPTVIKYASMVLIALFAIFFLLRPIVKRLTQDKAALEAMQNLQALTQGAGSALGEGSPELALGPGLGVGESLDRVKRLVKENPQQVALVLKGWIKEK